jgi:hypothetical protein
MKKIKKGTALSVPFLMEEIIIFLYKNLFKFKK